MKEFFCIIALISLMTPCRAFCLDAPAVLSTNPVEKDFSTDLDSPELGSLVDVFSSSESFGFQKWGLAKSVRFRAFPLKLEITGQQLLFSSSTTEITWFAQLSQKGQLRTIFKKGGFYIKWYSPDNRLYFEEDVSGELRRSGVYMHSVLKLPQPLPAELLGVWRVKVFKKDKLLDDRKFKIINVS